MKRTKALREKLKKVYAIKKVTDATEIGRAKNDLVQAIHLQNKLPKDKRDVEVIKKCAEGLQQLTKEKRFCDDFPSFSLFYKYFTDPRNKFTTEDIKEL